MQNMAKGFINIQIMIFIWVIGKMIILMVLGCIYLLMEICIKGYLKMEIISKANFYMPMVIYIKGSLKMDTGMDMV
jgi:hypothetical protein